MDDFFYEDSDKFMLTLALRSNSFNQYLQDILKFKSSFMI